MSLGRGFRSGSRRTNPRIAVVLAGLFAFLVARNVPPGFPRLSSPHTAISPDSHHSTSDHDRRPRFDNDGSHWSAPVHSFRPGPPSAESPHLASAEPFLYRLPSKGFHYNRPPPAS